MYTNSVVTNCFKSLIGWKQHYDTSEILIDSLLTVSDSNEYFQDFHPALRLDLIKSILPQNRTLDSYLEEKRDTAIVQLLSDVTSEKQYDKYARKTLIDAKPIIDKYGWINDIIINEGRFVGFKIKTKLSTGLRNVIKSIGIQVTQTQTLKMYLYHSSKMDAIETFDIVVGGAVQWNWSDVDINLDAITKDIVGGVWIVGYYQDDLVGQAIGYTELNWINGPCSTCDGGYRLNAWRETTKFIQIIPIYVPAPSLNGIQMFDLNDSMEVLNNNFGMNLRISAECDLSQFFCENRFSLKKALGLKLSYLVLKDIQFSQQINYIEESLKHMIIRDLEGDKDTNYINIVDQYLNEIKAVNFDHSAKDYYCLPCDNNKGVSYDVA